MWRHLCDGNSPHNKPVTPKSQSPFHSLHYLHYISSVVVVIVLFNTLDPSNVDGICPDCVCVCVCVRLYAQIVVNQQPI